MFDEVYMYGKDDENEVTSLMSFRYYVKCPIYFKVQNNSDTP